MLPLPQKEQRDFTKNKVGHDLDMKLVSALDFLLYSHDLFFEKPKTSCCHARYSLYHQFDMILPI